MKIFLKEKQIKGTNKKKLKTYVKMTNQITRKSFFAF